jgi:hypothetical protein
VATTTMTTVDNLLKEVYEDGGINDQLQSEVTAIKRVERSGEGVTHEVGGKYVRFPVRTQRNHGIGARNENEALPIPRTQSYASAQVKLKYLYGAMELTGQTFELADKNPQAFASALDQEVNGLKEGLLKDLARQVYGTNKGVMATATAGGTTTTFLLPDANAQYLEIGMFVDVFQSNDAVRVADVTITNITSSAGTTTVTFSPASGTSTVSGDYITRDNSVGKEISGFDSIVQSTGVLYNIDPAVTPVWSANVDSNSGTNRALSEGLMINMVDTIRKRGGGVPTAIFAGLGVRRAYFNLLVQQRRITNTQDFAGGFKGLEFSVGANTIPLIEDVDAKPNTMYFMNEKQLKVYEAGDWSFMDRDGSKWQRVITSAGTFDAFDAILFKYMELATHRRNAHGRINDLTEA